MDNAQTVKHLKIRNNQYMRTMIYLNIGLFVASLLTLVLVSMQR